MNKTDRDGTMIVVEKPTPSSTETRNPSSSVGKMNKIATLNTTRKHQYTACDVGLLIPLLDRERTLRSMI